MKRLNRVLTGSLVVCAIGAAGAPAAMAQSVKYQSVRNVRGSIASTGPAPRTVCVADDVYTSGATADAYAAALRRAGARRVEIVTLARAVR